MEVDYERSKRLTAILSGKEKLQSRHAAKLKAIKEEMDSPIPWLFFYSVYTFVENKQYSTLTEVQASGKVTEHRNLQIYYCRLVGSSDRTPEILKNRKIVKKELLSHEELADLIYQTTSVRITESDLMIKKTLSRAPLHERIQAFMQRDRANDEHTQRIMNCLQEPDPGKRKKCLNGICSISDSFIRKALNKK